MDLFRRKSVASLQATAAADHSLKRALGPGNLVLLGIGAIIGAGIFVLTGQQAAQNAGPGIVFSFILAGLGCAFAGLCYAEFAAMIPIAGSAYTYGYATLGEFFAWIIGWDLILEYLFAASTVAVGWSGYAVSLLRDFGITIPASFTSAPFNHAAPPDVGLRFWELFTHGWIRNPDAVVNIPAMFIVALLTVLLVIGIKESASVNNIIVYIKLAVVLVFIAAGAAYMNKDNWTPFIPPVTPDGHFGIGGITRSAGVIFFAYIGFDAVSTAAQEARNPQKDMPIGILGSLAICTVLYIAVSLVLTGIVKYTELNVPDPIAVGINAVPQLAWLRFPVKLGAIAGLSSVILVMLLGQPRIFYSMAKDGLLPPAFAQVHPKFQTPYLASILTGGLAMLMAGLFPIGLLGELVSIGTLLAFVIVCAGVLVLRYTDPDIPRPFRTPLVPLVPVLGILACGFMMYRLPIDTWARLFVWMVIGLAIYFLYGRKHSALNRA
jgi:basic amino acid/polyamine antiporter, APA family